MGNFVLSLMLLLIGTILGKLFKIVLVCIMWLAAAIIQILLVIGFFILVAYMASNGWITI